MNIDKKFKKLGYKKKHESHIVTTYEKIEKTGAGDFVHIIELCHKRHLKGFVCFSYEEGTYHVVRLSEKEMKLCLKAMKEFNKRYIKVVAQNG